MRFDFRFLLVLAAAAFALTACSDKASETSGSNALVPIAVGPAKIQIELALDQAQMARGLMFRDAMPEKQGMLFIYESPTQMSFWMRNTRIPLDIGFFTADGRLREVHAMYPFDETSVKSVRSDLLFALEMNQGWFARNGIKTGSQLDLEALRKAVAERKQRVSF